MNTYWDEFMDLLQAGRINDEYGHPLAMTFLTPRGMLQAFYDWLSEKGQIVHGSAYSKDTTRVCVTGAKTHESTDATTSRSNHGQT